MARYTVHPIADENCDSLKADVVIIETDNLDTALWHASHNSCVWGAGIHDTVTDRDDFGHGFGVPVPDDAVEASRRRTREDD